MKLSDKNILVFKMKKIIITISLCLIFIVISCKEDKVVEPVLFTISGSVENESGEKISTDIFLISEDTLKTKSNTDGSFIFENVSEGEYNLSIVPLDYLRFDTVITVTQNINLKIKLNNVPNLGKPEPPTNFRVESISETQIKIL